MKIAPTLTERRSNSRDFYQLESIGSLQSSDEFFAFCRAF